MAFSEQKLFRYIHQGEIEQAVLYVAEHIPDYLYKYYSLSGDVHNELDEKKINSLKSNNSWFDLAKNQNDPLDMKMAYVSDELHPEATDGQIDAAKMLMDSLANSMLLCSFLGSDQFNLPMWFAYANNHKGYCVKYKVNKKQVVWKVLYNDYRVPVLSIPLNLMHEMDKSIKDGEETELLEKYRYITFLILNTKHSSWKYENEYRILYPNENGVGMNVSNELLGLTPSEFFIGLNCIDDHKKVLNDICKNNLNCRCFQAYTSQTKILDFIEV